MNKKLLFSIPLIACLLTSCKGETHYSEDKYELGIQWVDSASEDFRILQLCDIHLGQSDIYEKHFKLMDKTIRDADADLIVLNGDSFTYADKGVVTKLFSFIDSYQIPWTFTYGNHDDQGYYSDTYIQEVLGSKKNLYQYAKFINLADDDVTGRSNFVINIYDRSKDADGKFVNTNLFQVYLLESHNYNFDTWKYDFIKQDQIDWYERMVKYYTDELTGYVTPSVMYFHVPLPEFFSAWDEYKNGVTTHNVKLIMGEMTEFSGGPLPESDLHLFDKVKDLGSTLAISCAHDHNNDSVINYDGINLCFGVHATDRIYYDANKIGGQVIVIDHEDPTHKTLKYENIYHTYDEVEGK